MSHHNNNYRGDFNRPNPEIVKETILVAEAAPQEKMGVMSFLKSNKNLAIASGIAVALAGLVFLTTRKKKEQKKEETPAPPKNQQGKE